MFEWFKTLGDNGLGAPHGYCLLWRPELVWTHVIADALIAAAYFSIPVALVAFVRKRRDIEFGFIFWLFALFILACGATHVISIWNLWNNDYGFEGAVKALTAVASVLTAIMVWPLIPKALSIPSPTSLQSANEQLTRTLDDRDAALARLREEMTQRREAQRQLVQAQKVEALGQLTGGIAHDFNNLLQAISSGLQLIERAPDREERVLKWAAMAREATEKAERLTAQLLTFSRQKAVSVESIEITPMVEGLQELLNRTLGPKVQLGIATEGRAVVDADRTQLELAVMNLVINARDAMPDGGEIAVRAAPVDLQDDPILGDGSYVAISVSDNGDGMPEEIRERVFDPFFTTKASGKGTGLGLSMVHGFAQQAGGKVDIESEVGEGTTVTIILPKSGSQDPNMPIHKDVTEDVDLAGKTILVVDDDDGVRTSIIEVLELLGAGVVTAANGAEALDRLEKGAEVDAVLTDYAMPEMDGAELAKELHARDPGMRIVVATGYADFTAIEDALGRDATVLRKPFSLGDLAQALNAGTAPD